MCGICGYLHLDRSIRPSEKILRDMMATLAHRGPDDEGIYIKDNAALGHKRLSIIDLKTGHQPMTSPDGSVAVVYNGEVYNFGELKESLAKKGRAFRTYSDTEVILAAYEEYGEDCLKYFNGMFAFAIWDSHKNSLFLARDRFGKKPLYYAQFDNQFIFGSELKALLKHPSVRKEIDLNALAKYLAYEYVPSPYSIFKGIRKLEAGTYLYLKDGKIETKRYWDLEFKRNAGLGPEETESRLEDLLKESVRKRLISDVPLGVFLSGGIDSSCIVAMMAQLVRPKDIKTFSIGFKERDYDELSDARRIASHFGTDHREETLDPGVMLEIFPKILDILDEPFADSSIIPTYLVSRFTRQHVKVALGGDGGDELFFGYPSFKAHKIDGMLSGLPAPFKILPLELINNITPASLKHKGMNLLAHRFARGLKFPKNVRHQTWIGALTPDREHELFLPSKAVDYDAIYETTSQAFKNAGSLDSLERASYVYIKTYMTDDILAKVDRASMANSLEVRAPFLDTELAEFAASIPPSLKLKGFTAKWILKDLFKNKLPAQTLKKGKHGFAVPVTKWLKDDLRPMLLDAFSRKKIEREGIFDYNTINRMVQDFANNKNDMRRDIWTLFMFEMWYDKWM